MKKEILKIAGVKSEKEFYKKFPTEEAFMKAHGKAFKKAQIGAYIGGEQDPGFQPIAFQDVYDEADYAITGMTDEMRKEEARRNAEAMAAQKQASSGGGGGLGDVSMAFMKMGEMFGEEGAAALAGAKKGKKIKKAQGGIEQKPVESDYPDYESYTAAMDEWMSSLTTSSGGLGSIKNPALNFKTKQGGNDQLTKTIGKYAPAAGQIIQGIQQLREEKRALERAEQAQAVSDISLQAARTRPEETQRRYVRPEDITNTGEEFFPIYGVGTNVLARDGKMVGGNPGEIANTFAPGTLYDNLGYEPLNDSERYKQFVDGGKMRKAQGGDWMAGTGFYNLAASGGGDAASQLMTGITGENAGGNIGGTVGKLAGTAIGGPVGGMIGQVGGQLIGSLLDRKPGKIKRAKAATQQNIQTMALQQGIPRVQAQYSSFMEDGGEVGNEYKWVSHTWQPQKIMSFGGHNLKDLLKPPHDADMLRAGGHLKAYTPPSERAMSTERPIFEDGGDLQVHWGGKAKVVSTNKFLPNGGKSYKFVGNSHEEANKNGDTGIGITWGDNPVEVEDGEPAQALPDKTSLENEMLENGGSTGESLNVYGNLVVSDWFLPLFQTGPKKLHVKKREKYKNYVNRLNKIEAKQNKLIDKASQFLSENDSLTPIDKITFNSYQMNILGGNSVEKDIADKKMALASAQSSVNDTAEEMGLVADDLAKGKVKMDKEAMKEAAKFGKMIKAQNGYKSKYGLKPWTGDVTTGIKNASLYTEKEWDEIAEQLGFDKTGKKGNKAFQEFLFSDPDTRDIVIRNHQRLYSSDPSQKTDWFDDKLGAGWSAAELKAKEMPEVVVTSNFKKRDLKKTAEDTKEKDFIKITPYKRDPYLDALGQVLPYIRPTDQEQLDPTQLMGEMYALATNQLEPVQAQTMQPLLSVPYDISLQDQLNENEATFRSQQRLLGYNPAAQSMLNAQKYMANQRLLAEQFRANQAMRDAVYRDNRNLLNQFGLQNLAILDKQYERQTMAKSLTKATTQAALNSISDKFLRNQLENRTLATMENLYNYRFDPRFRTINMNAPYQPLVPTVYGGTAQRVPVLDQNGNILYYEQRVGDDSTAVVSSPANIPGQPQTTIKDKEKKTGKMGVSVKNKNMNSSIVKAFKNL